jgi:hypothetical protein
MRRLAELGLTSQEERRHQANMLQVFKILAGKYRVQREHWFRMAAKGGVGMRQAAGLLNVVKSSAKLEVRSNFFTVRAADRWNNVPEQINDTLCREVQAAL